MAKEIVQKSKDDLKKDLADKQIRLRDIRFGIAGSKSKNVKETAHLKKEIAQIKTILTSNHGNK